MRQAIPWGSKESRSGVVIIVDAISQEAAQMIFTNAPNSYNCLNYLHIATFAMSSTPVPKSLGNHSAIFESFFKTYTTIRTITTTFNVEEGISL
jgi:hypothetical protein